MEGENQNKGGGLIYQHHYDRDKEADSETQLVNLIRSVQEWMAKKRYFENGQYKIMPITDTMAIAEIRGICSQVKTLMIKYKEWEAASLIQIYIEFLSTQSALDAPATLKNLDNLLEMTAYCLGIKHNFRDRVDKTRKWDQELKKKLEFDLNPMNEADKAFFDSLKYEWEQLAFLTTYYVVKLEGDAHILLSGPNLSGKTNTDVCFLSKCSKFLVDYWHVKKYNEFYVKGDEKRGMPAHPEAADIPQDRFKIKKDVYATPDPQELERRFESEQYQTIAIVEGMRTGTNLQSMKAELISLGVKRFTSRSYHNIVIWEYQVQQRPTALMLEGMNFWFQKMKKRHFILSVASTLVRKKDPYYMKELEKCRTDKDIGVWMEDINPNYVHTFKAPRLKPKFELRLKRHIWEQEAIANKANDTGKKLTSGYNLMLEDVWTRINVQNKLMYSELEAFLDKLGYDKKDKAAFMRDYGKLNRLKQYEGYVNDEKKQQELEVAN